jgi:5-methylcytosine-specific restriction enzyme subunit McrC
MVEIILIEYKPKYFNKEEIPEVIAEIIWQNYRQYIEIEFPSLPSKQRWKLTTKGYIGIIPVTSNFTIRILPKTSIHSIWKMIDWVGELTNLKFFTPLTDCNSIEDLCDLFARLLAKNILNRSKKGLFSTYISENNRLNLVRGRIDWNKAARSPWDTRLHCHYERQTADITDNQILLWTLYQLGRTQQLFQLETQTLLRSAYRALSGSISLQPFAAKDCRDRHYNRLNQDYQIIHSLCAFFLENLHPGYQEGNYKALPFLLNTAFLYEKFVYVWLKKNLPVSYDIKAQENHSLSKTINYKIDLVLYDRTNQKDIAVLDTKYKIPDKIDNKDINQVITYAHLKQVQRAILIYPQYLPAPLNQLSHGLYLQTLCFGLDDSLETAGQKFLKSLLQE